MHYSGRRHCHSALWHEWQVDLQDGRDGFNRLQQWRIRGSFGRHSKGMSLYGNREGSNCLPSVGLGRVEPMFHALWRWHPNPLALGDEDCAQWRSGMPILEGDAGVQHGRLCRRVPRQRLVGLVGLQQAVRRWLPVADAHGDPSGDQWRRAVPDDAVSKPCLQFATLPAPPSGGSPRCAHYDGTHGHSHPPATSTASDPPDSDSPAWLGQGAAGAASVVAPVQSVQCRSARPSGASHARRWFANLAATKGSFMHLV